MLINPNNLVKISTYAKMRKLSPTRIYQIKKTLNIILIDGYQYVDITNPHNVEGKKRRGNESA